MNGNGLAMCSAGFQSTSLSNLHLANSFYSYFSFLRHSPKTNWRCCNWELQMNYLLNSALHIAFVTNWP